MLQLQELLQARTEQVLNLSEKVKEFEEVIAASRKRPNRLSTKLSGGGVNSTGAISRRGSYVGMAKMLLVPLSEEKFSSEEAGSQFRVNRSTLVSQNGSQAASLFPSIDQMNGSERPSSTSISATTNGKHESESRGDPGDISAGLNNEEVNKMVRDAVQTIQDSYEVKMDQLETECENEVLAAKLELAEKSHDWQEKLGVIRESVKSIADPGRLKIVMERQNSILQYAAFFFQKQNPASFPAILPSTPILPTSINKQSQIIN